MTTPTDPTAALKLAQDKLHLIEIAAAGAAVTNSRDLDDWRGDMEDIRTHAAAALAAIDALPAPSGEQAALLVRDIANDLGIKPMIVCKALEAMGYGKHSVNMALTADMARALTQHFAPAQAAPEPQAAASPEPTAEQRQAGTRAWMEAIADPDMSPTDKVAHVYRAMQGARTAQAAPAPQAIGDLATRLRTLADLRRLDGEHDEAAVCDEAAAVVASQAAPAPQAEPVARVVSWTSGSYSRNYRLEWLRDVPEGTELYAAPQPATAVAAPVQPLTEEQIAALLPQATGANHAMKLAQLAVAEFCRLNGFTLAATTAKG